MQKLYKNNMTEEEKRLLSYLTTKQVKIVEIDHEYGNIYFYFEDDSKIVIIGLEDNIIVDFSE